jgi:hypothetical protein
MDDQAGADVEVGAAPEAEDHFCPLAGFDVSAVEWCMPPVLRRMADAESAGGGDGVPIKPLRIWVRQRTHRKTPTGSHTTS